MGPSERRNSVRTGGLSVGVGGVGAPATATGPGVVPVPARDAGAAKVVTRLESRASARGVQPAERHGPGIVPVAAGGARAPRIFRQLGAFVDRRDAERLQRRLHGRWPRVHIEAGISRGQRIYRVRLGPLRDVDEADRLTALIQDMGLEEPHVVID